MGGAYQNQLIVDIPHIFRLSSRQFGRDLYVVIHRKICAGDVCARLIFLVGCLIDFHRGNIIFADINIQLKLLLAEERTGWSYVKI